MQPEQGGGQAAGRSNADADGCFEGLLGIDTPHCACTQTKQCLHLIHHFIGLGLGGSTQAFSAVRKLLRGPRLLVVDLGVAQDDLIPILTHSKVLGYTFHDGIWQPWLCPLLRTLLASR